jgi:aspartyl-tRNA(Asn)/glutamyl-tRNA(Gln) amidotransferase subunit A
MDTATYTIEEAHALLREKKISVRELVTQYTERAKEKNKKLNAFLEFFDVDEQILRAEEKFENGTDTLLTGIPVALKDNILIKGEKVTAGSKILEGYTATYDATVTKLLKEAGAIIIGRTNMDEFAMGSSTENSAYGVVKNPHDESKVPGGSSGGSAAAVAMDGVPLAFGSDTGGSIRQPAAFCGIVGFKPTFDTISRFGLIALASSLDQIGPFAHTVRDAEIAWELLYAYDPMDSTSVPMDKRVTSVQKPKRLGVPRAFISGDGIEPEVRTAFEETLKNLETKGYEIVSVDIPLIEYSLPVYYILMPAESSTNLSRFDGIRYGLSKNGETLFDVYAKTRGEGFGRETRRRIVLGTYVLSHGYYDAYYKKAVDVRTRITQSFKKIFEDVDAIVTPTTPTVAFSIGEKANDPVSMYLSDIFTVPANIAGLPSLSVPIGQGKENLPIGFLITGPHFSDKAVFTIGKDVEETI